MSRTCCVAVINSLSIASRASESVVEPGATLTLKVASERGTRGDKREKK
jgi:hypothetical protein